MTLEITVRDTESGHSETATVPNNDYFIVCTGMCHVAGVTQHANGTHQLTVKGRRGNGTTITLKKGH